MLDHQDRQTLRLAATSTIYVPGERLFAEGEPAYSALVIETGWLKISNVASNGATELQALRTTGDLVGESAAADQPRTSTVTAATEVRALVVPAHAFTAFLQDSAQARLALQCMYRDRMIESDRRCLRLGGATARRRLAQLFLNIVDRAGHIPQNGNGIVLEPPLSQEELGQLIRVARQTVETTLRDWRRRGIVSTAPRKITLLNVSDLRRIAGHSR
jgi:CRP-like cAMP-binding protein